MIATIAIEDGNSNDVDDENDESIEDDDEFQSPRNKIEDDDDDDQGLTQQQQKNNALVRFAGGGGGGDASPLQSPTADVEVQEKQEQPKREEGALVAANEKTTTSAATKSNKQQEEGEQAEEDDGPAQPPIKLYKSTRFKGYLTIALASIINQNAATLSSDPAYVNAVPSSPKQQNYAQTVSIISAIICGICVVLHLDRYTMFKNIWSTKLFSPKSKIELLIIGFLCLWWSVAVVVQTGVRGIAGDGKEQYNLYCSTWLCCYVAFWTMERKLLEFGYTTFRTFVMAWPYRAPGWIAIFLTDFFTLFWYVDLFVNTSKNPDRVAEQLQPFYSNVPQSQYQWLIFVAAITLLPSGVFIFAELVRQNRSGSSSTATTAATRAGAIRERIVVKSSSQENKNKDDDDVTGNTSSDGGADDADNTGAVQTAQKPHLELILEGFCLFLLVASWIPCCVVATTPGGFASLIGNAYFFTWATTIYVVETFLWFIHDFRGNVHKSIEQSELEYKRHQQEVLEKSRQYMNNNNNNQRRRMTNEEDVDDEEEEIHFVNGFDYENSNDAEETKQKFGNGDRHGEEGRAADEEHWNMYMSPTSRDIHSPARFQMSYEDSLDGDDNDDVNDDDSIKQELRLKQTNTDQYFETLNDILE